MSITLVARLLFTGLAVLVFAGGTIILAVVLLAPPPNPTIRSETAEGLSLFFVLIWPPILLVVWVCGAIALLFDKRPQSAIPLLGAVAAVGVGVWAAVFLVNLLAAMLMPKGDYPLRGVPAVLIVLVFLALNLVVILYAWRYLLHGRFMP